MNGRILLDTNIVIALMANDPRVVQEIRARIAVFLAAIVMGELFYGAFRSGRVAANLSTLETLMTSSSILNVDEETARVYGRVKHQLREKGRPIPDNDIWIAALALHHNLTLVKRDSHFDEVEGLRVENW